MFQAELNSKSHQNKNTKHIQLNQPTRCSN